MISRDSKSYLYLAIAQHYGVSYREVLRFSDICILNSPPPFSEWRLAVWLLEGDRLEEKLISELYANSVPLIVSKGESK